MAIKSSQFFVDFVKSNFRYLIDDYGFFLDTEKQVGNAASVRYCSDKVYVVIFIGPPEFEPKMAFGRIGVDDKPDAYSFEQGDLVLLPCCEGWRWRQGPESGDQLTLKEFARLLKDCGDACLRGDDCTYADMRRRRDNWVAGWKDEERDNPVRQAAESAWQSKDYAAVVRHYRQISGDLTATEQKRLAFSEKKLGKMP